MRNLLRRSARLLTKGKWHRAARVGLLLLLLGAVLLAGLVASDWANSRQFARAVPLPPAQPAGRSRALGVAVIGDSWVAWQRIDRGLNLSLVQLGRPARVQSFGQPGARSRQVYENLFKPAAEPFSSQPVLFSGAFQACVVVAGVNDTASHLGKDFYVHHMLLIVDALLQRQIHPVILEVPGYGIESAESANLVGYVRRRLMRAVHDGGHVNVIGDYRAALRQALARRYPNQAYTLVQFSPAQDDYRPGERPGELDRMHLNAEGSARLGHQIAQALAGWAASAVPADR